MKSTAISVPDVDEEFHIADVSVIATGHFVHDIFTAFISPLLPEIIRTLHISLTQAGALSAAMQIPSVLNPLIGYLDDRRNLRFLMILAPGITATLLSSIGLATNYASLIVLLFTAGISIAAFHAIAPARLARYAGRNVGMGMSLFMGGGEFGRTVGPLLAVWAVSALTLKGIVPLAVLGWMVSLIMWARLNNSNRARAQSTITTRPFPRGTIRFFAAATILFFFRGLMISGLGMYLPTFMTGEGSSLWAAGSTLALYQLCGSFGALAGGTISDRFGRRRVLAVTMAGSSLSLLLFLSAASWLSLPILVIIGFLNLTTQPVMLALIQDRFKENRSMANGTYMGLTFIALSVASVLVGALGDWIGLRSAFFWISLLSLFAIPTLLFMHPPEKTSAGSQ